MKKKQVEEDLEQCISHVNGVHIWLDNLPENERGLNNRYMKWLPFLEERLKNMYEVDGG